MDSKLVPNADLTFILHKDLKGGDPCSIWVSSLIQEQDASVSTRAKSPFPSILTQTSAPLIFSRSIS